jgi:hypothetical protein
MKGQLKTLVNCLEKHKNLLACLNCKEKDSGVSGMSLREWETVGRQSLACKVASLLYGCLMRTGLQKSVPPGVRDRLRLAYLTALSRNLRHYARLTRLLERLDEEDIPVIVLKGAHLAEKVYGDIALRYFDDIDLMFQEKDLSRCDDIVHEMAGLKDRSRMYFDIHWNIDFSTANLPVRVESIWERSERTTIGGMAARVLCPEDLLLHQCMHISFHHRFQSMGVRALCDIREILVRLGPILDWQKIKRRAAEWGIGNSIQLTLTLARDLLEANVPTHAIDGTKPAGLAGTPSRWAIRQMFEPEPPSHFLSPYFWAMLHAKTIRGKLSNLRRLALPSHSHMIKKRAISGGIGNYSGSYAIRVKKHLKTYAKAVFALIGKNSEMASEAQREIENIKIMEWLSEKTTTKD